MLPCGYNVMQTYHALKKAWKGYHAAMADMDNDFAVRYASVIQRLQRELGGRVADFPHLKMIAGGEEEDLAKFISNELRGDEPLINVENNIDQVEIDPLYAYKSEPEPEPEPEPAYEFRWSSNDLEKLKRFS
jgi:isopentenyldiphosphate isomerase